MNVWWRGGDWEKVVSKLLVLLTISHFIGVISAFDCRIFPFHPNCRGSYGKRSLAPPLHAASTISTTKSNSNKNEEETPRHSHIILSPDQLAMLDWFLRAELLRGKIVPQQLVLICRRYVFAPVCRGVTSKRSHLPPLINAEEEEESKAIKDILAKIAEIQHISLLENKIEKPSKSMTQDGNAEPVHGDGEKSRNTPFPVQPMRVAWPQKGTEYENNPDDVEGHFYYTYYYPYSGQDRSRSKRETLDALETFSSFYKPHTQTDHRNKRDTLDDLATFSSFYKPLKKARSKRDLYDGLGTFSSFYKPHKRDMIDDLGTFSSFYNPGRSKRDVLDNLGTFSSFYKPIKPDLRSKRDALDDLSSFSSFYKPIKPDLRSKRDALDDLSSFSSFYNPSKYRGKRDVLTPFSSFYKPIGTRSSRPRRHVLNTFSSFYQPSDTYRVKRDVLLPFSSFYSPKRKQIEETKKKL